MSSILNVIEKLKLNVLNIEDVPESFSSDVYKLGLASGEDVYVKIPFNKDKLFREFQMLETLKDVLPVPKVLDIWYGDEITTGALLLSAIQGVPCTENMDEKLYFQMGVYHAMLHEVKTPGYGYHSTNGFIFLDQNNWRLHISGKSPAKSSSIQHCMNDAFFILTAFSLLYLILTDPVLYIWIFDLEIYW
ncbi:hypothetical protein [Paenibacillus sp. FSL W7-1088]|uniref:hypothetical protein n=1 Tax=unclassified Paenibacillus TaxID=185978 RepID=UPI0026A26CEC